jgi:hypothetical protein
MGDTSHPGDRGAAEVAVGAASDAVRADLADEALAQVPADAGPVPEDEGPVADEVQASDEVAARRKIHARGYRRRCAA